MATEPEDQDDTLDLTQDMELDESDQQDADESAETGEQDEGEEETVIGFEGEADEDQAGDSSVIRALRQQLRDAKQRAKDAESKIVKPKVERQPEPTLADCGYDEDEFKAKWKAWNATEVAADAEEAKAEEVARKANESWQNDLASYAQRKSTLGVEDFDEAEGVVLAALNDVQRAVIIKASADPAALIVALSRSDEKLAELAKFDDPIKMAAAVARMEGGVKVTKRRKGPAIDRPEGGSAQMPGGADKQLEKLEKEADRTGDRSKVIAYKRDQRAKADKGKK